MEQSSAFQSSSVLFFASRKDKAKGWQAELEKSSAKMAGERMVEKAGKKARQMEEKSESPSPFLVRHFYSVINIAQSASVHATVLKLTSR